MGENRNFNVKVRKKISTAKANKAKKEGKKHCFLHPHSPPNLGPMRLCGKNSSMF
jgi:hypothetical protein